MRLRLLRRRLSVSAPRVIVRSRMPWPVQWAFAALMLGLCAAIALWAFEFGRTLAGLDRNAQRELSELRAQVQRLRDERDKAQAIAATAESLLQTERVAQARLAQQLRDAEGDVLELRADLGFFERLIPASGNKLSVRALQAEPAAPGRVRYQVLVMQGGRKPAPFRGRYELVLSGTKDGEPWTQPITPGPLTVKQYARVEGTVEHPADAVVKNLQLRVLDEHGGVRAAQTAQL